MNFFWKPLTYRLALSAIGIFLLGFVGVKSISNNLLAPSTHYLAIVTQPERNDFPSDPDVADLTYNLIKTSNVDSRNDPKDFYRIYLAKGYEYHISLSNKTTNNEKSDVDLFMFDDQNNLIKFSDGVGFLEENINITRNEKSGIYYVLVAAFANSGFTTYELVVRTNAPIPPTLTPTPTSTLAATATPISTTDPSTFIYIDDFSNTASGWSIGSDSRSDYGYQNGEYEIKLKTASEGISFARAFNFNSQVRYTLEVTVRFVNSQLGEAGLIFGVDDNSSFYRFTINPFESTYRLDGGIFGFQTIIGSTTSNKVNAGVNRLKVIHEGSKISLFINDDLVNVVSDTASSGNSAGMTVQASGPGSVPLPVRFDNFRVVGTRAN